MLDVVLMSLGVVAAWVFLTTAIAIGYRLGRHLSREEERREGG